MTYIRKCIDLLFIFISQKRFQLILKRFDQSPYKVDGHGNATRAEKITGNESSGELSVCVLFAFQIEAKQFDVHFLLNSILICVA